MRVLFTATPAVGLLHPLVPFASAAAAVGHEVAFATGAGMAGLVEGSRFDCFPVGSERLTNDEVDGLFPEMRGRVGKERAALHWRNVFAGYLPKALIGDLLDLAGTWRPDVIVRDDVNFGACIAAERLGILHAAVQTVAFRPNLYSAIHELLDERRGEVGLAPDVGGAMPFRHLFLSPFPKGYLDPDVVLPATTRSVRPSPFDRSGGEALPDWVAHLSERPLVYVTLGTVFNHRPDVFSSFIEGLRDEAVELVVTVGRDQDPGQFGLQPPNVHIERYVPQTLLFPRCSLVVCHGGSGTTMAALAQGLPMVVVPIAADQPENAERCAALGVARVLRAADLSAEAARSAVLAVLAERKYRRAATDMRDQINALPGPDFAITLLEELVAGPATPH